MSVAALNPPASSTGAAELAEVFLSVPGIRCAACIAAIERGLGASTGVEEARVNLSLRRVRVRGRLGPEALIARLHDLGFEAQPLDLGTLGRGEADPVGRDLLLRLGVAFFGMMNVMGLSVAVWAGATAGTRSGLYFISALIALPTTAYAGWPFFRSAWAGLRARRLGMDAPISLALILACAVSVSEWVQGGRHAYFEAAVMLAFALLCGRYLDHRTRAAARSAAQELAALEVPRALRLVDGRQEVVGVAELRPGDLVLVHPGERVPADGIVVEGESELDRSPLTGESLPAPVIPGAAVSAAEGNLTGPLTLRVTAAGRDSSLARLASLVAVAEESRGRHSSLADRAARAYAPIVHVLALGAFAAWMARTGGDLRTALNVASAVLIITCPCGLALAVPAVLAAASGRLFRLGLLVKSGTALERLASVDTVVFDKTGTLTLGAPEPFDLTGYDRGDLAVALALAQGSGHPLARSLAREIARMRVEPARLSALSEVPGHGIEGIWDGCPVRLGRAEWVGATPERATATHLRVAEAAPAAFRFADALRPGAVELVARLKAGGLEVHLLSGDVAPAVEAMAARLGIPRWTATAGPEAKADYVAGLAAEGRRVLMVGDGLNDTAALACAWVSISPASALEAARAASDVVLLGQDLRPLADALDVARASVARIRENFAASALYNVLAVPVALLGLATPLIAAIAMSVSSVSVSLNALRVR